MRKKIETCKILMKIQFAEAAQIQGNKRAIIQKETDLKSKWMHCYLKHI